MHPSQTEKALVAVDLVVLTIKDEAFSVLLIQRGIEPFRGKWALPGGFVRPGESLEAAAHRELEEETGLTGDKVGYMEQLATFGEPLRDPRRRVISVAYMAFVPNLPDPSHGGDAQDARVVTLADITKRKYPLAFDHDEILGVGIERARAKLEYTSLATRFCDSLFTIQQLRKIYELVWDTTLEPANFHRKVTKTAGFVVATNKTTAGDAGRPAQLFKRGSATFLAPPLMRPTQKV